MKNKTNRKRQYEGCGEEVGGCCKKYKQKVRMKSGFVSWS